MEGYVERGSIVCQTHFFLFNPSSYNCWEQYIVVEAEVFIGLGAVPLPTTILGAVLHNNGSTPPPTPTGPACTRQMQ